MGKPEHCRKCKIKDCIKGKGLSYCFECPDYPCKLIKNLEKSCKKVLTLSNTDDIIMERVRQSDALGEVSERFMVPVLKTGEGQTSVGSNPTFSAIEVKNFYFYLKSFFLKESTAWRSTQVAEGAPLERE